MRVAVVISAFFSLLIGAFVIGLGIKYRRRHANEIGHREHAPEWLELLWTAIPLAILLGLFLWGTKVFYTLSRPPAEATEFLAVGRQWMWKFQHPQGTREINDLHVPVGQAIKLKMTSEDVIHSLFVPAFRVKTDVVPGRYTTVWFKATKPGTYHLFCAEYCGTKHSEMGGSVIVMDPAEYQAWLDGRPAERNPLANGALLFQNLRCDTCHTPGPSARGPELAGRFGRDVTLSDGQTVRFDERYVRESVLEPAKKLSAGFQPLMPSYQGQIGESDILVVLV